MALGPKWPWAPSGPGPQTAPKPFFFGIAFCTRHRFFAPDSTTASVQRPPHFFYTPNFRICRVSFLLLVVFFFLVDECRFVILKIHIHKQRHSWRSTGQGMLQFKCHEKAILDLRFVIAIKGKKLSFQWPRYRRDRRRVA